MRIDGLRIHQTRLIETSRYTVVVTVEMVIPTDDPTEPCYASETVNFLKEVRERAESGDLEWLKQHGRVFETATAL
jgi:hypothetical protein